MAEAADRLSRLGWVTDLWAAVSLALGDYVPGVSDIDLVAVVEGPIGTDRRSALAQVHRSLDAGAAAALRWVVVTCPRTVLATGAPDIRRGLMG